MRSGWYAVAPSPLLRARPRRVWLGGVPLALWRDAQGRVCALEDRCPHRGAPLSQGEVREGAIACPYHGWRFGRDGGCLAMPALAGAPPTVRARAFPAAEADGLIFVRWGREGGAAPEFAPLIPGVRRVRLIHQEVATAMADIAENILDTTHTGVVHRGFLRRAQGRLTSPRVEAGDDWIEAHYPAHATPSGVIGRLIGGPRYTIVDRFRAPAQAEVEYRAGAMLAFAIRFHLAPTTDGRVAAFARMAVARSWLGGVQRAGLGLLLARLFKEDEVMLEQVGANCADTPDRPLVHAPQDLLRPGIEAILRGEAPAAPAAVPDLWV